MPRVSIIIATFDRPALLVRALEHIRQQTFQDYEVIVADDGSSEATKVQYRELLQQTGLDQDQRLHWIYMPERSARMSNPSTGRNRALAAADADLITFCDDDDYWSDPGHLQIAVDEFEHHPDLDFYFADQQGMQNGQLILPRWQPGLYKDISGRPEGESSDEIHDVPLSIYCRHWTPHTNTALIRRSLLERMGDFWAYTPMEGDVDFVYRAADQARRIRFRDAVVCVHEIPDKSKKANASSRISQAERYMYRMAIANHLMFTTASPEVHRFARELDRYAAQKFAAEVAEQNPSTALYYAWRGFCAGPSLGALRDCLRYLWRRFSRGSR